MAETAELDKTLEAVEKKFGFLPNIIKDMAEKAPPLVKIYLGGVEALEGGVLRPKELQAVFLTISSYNKCGYCAQAHEKGSLAAGIGKEDADAIRRGREPSDERLKALVAATRRVLDKKGWLEEDDVKKVEASGVSGRELFEIVGALGVKTVSNYFNHINHTEIDPQLAE